MTSITKKLEFDAGHRVLGHEGVCRFLHGHRYVAEITCQAEDLDDIGRVIDFGVIKLFVGQWITDNWDHNIILNPKDPLLSYLRQIEERKPYVMKGSGNKANPTVENMVEDLFYTVQTILPNHIRVTKVRLWETPSSFAEFAVWVN